MTFAKEEMKRMPVILLCIAVLGCAHRTPVRPAHFAPGQDLLDLGAIRSVLTPDLTFDQAQRAFGGIHTSPIIFKGNPEMQATWFLSNGQHLRLIFRNTLLEASVRTPEGELVEEIIRQEHREQDAAHVFQKPRAVSENGER